MRRTSLLLERVRTILDKGVEVGKIRPRIDPLQLNHSITGLGFYYLNNRFTNRQIYDYEHISNDALTKRRAFMVEFVMRAIMSNAKIARRGSRGDMPQSVYSHMIVGGGTAGCVLAARLSETAVNNVLLLEAGSRDWHPYIHMPVGFAKMTGGGLTWGYKAVPQEHAGNRRILYAQGRVLGGGSSINAEVFTRGVPADFDRWARNEGCPGWSFEDVQPYFLKSEGNTALADEWHGTQGPLGVSNIDAPQPMTRAFVMACQQYGIPYTHDFNGASQAGTGYYQLNVVDGRRCPAARGYLDPARGRANLTILTRATSEQLLFDGHRVVGVMYRHRGKRVTAHAESEVIVTAGAIGSPKLLMLSGIGPGDHLTSLGINVRADVAEVGASLADHVNIDLVAELHGHESLDKCRKPHMAAWAGSQ